MSRAKQRMDDARPPSRTRRRHGASRLCTSYSVMSGKGRPRPAAIGPMVSYTKRSAASRDS